MKSFTLFIALLICVSVSAQLNIDSLRQQYKTKTMRIGNGIIIDGYRIGKTQVQNLMVISPEAANYYKLYVKNNRTGKILPYIGLAASIGGIILKDKNKSSALALYISGTTINVIGGIFRLIANNHLQNAVWTYNRDVLYPVK